MNVKATSDLPLSGITVIEFCQIAAGPFCGMLLADMGANVIKVEPPEGDGMRQWPPLSDGYSENFASLNRNKRSVVLNLKREEDVLVARKLIADSDVVIENNRPGVMQRLGLDYAIVSAKHPSLVYCSISAFGQTGPRAREGGFDLTIQAAAGVMSITGEAGGAPVKCGVPLADFATGLYSAYAIAAKLSDVRRGGRGGYIDASLFGCTLAIGALQTSEYFGTGKNPRKLGSVHPRNAPYQAYRAKDGWFAIAAGNDKLWAAVCEAIGRPELASDPRFLTTRDRALHQEVMACVLDEIFAERTVDDWMRTFDRVGVPHSRINGYSEALADPQTQHMGWVQSLDLGNGVRTRTFGCPLRLDGNTLTVARRPPALGEHNDDILSEYAVG